MLDCNVGDIPRCFEDYSQIDKEKPVLKKILKEKLLTNYKTFQIKYLPIKFNLLLKYLYERKHWESFYIQT